MAEPVVYVSTYKVKDGKLDDYIRFHDELAKVVAEEEPRVVAFLSFANEQGTEITGIHFFPDSAALDAHLGVLGRRMGLLATDLTAVFASLEPVRIEVFGRRPSSAVEMDQELSGSGVPFEIKTRLIGGFTHTAT